MLNIVFSSNKSLAEELWEYFVNKYFSPDIPYLENFSIKNSTLLSVRLIIVGICVGIIIAAAVNIYNKRYLGGFVRKMLSEDCLDADRAKTLSELGYLKKLGVRRVIGTNGILARWVRCAEEDEYYANAKDLSDNEDCKRKNTPAEFKRDTKSMHFYIPEEKKYAADVKFDAKGANWGVFILVTVLTVVLCLVACYLLPDMIKFVDNFISVING